MDIDTKLLENQEGVAKKIQESLNVAQETQATLGTNQTILMNIEKSLERQERMQERQLKIQVQQRDEGREQGRQLKSVLERLKDLQGGVQAQDQRYFVYSVLPGCPVVVCRVFQCGRGREVRSSRFRGLSGRLAKDVAVPGRRQQGQLQPAGGRGRAHTRQDIQQGRDRRACVQYHGACECRWEAHSAKTVWRSEQVGGRNDISIYQLTHLFSGYLAAYVWMKFNWQSCRTSLDPGRPGSCRLANRLTIRSRWRSQERGAVPGRLSDPC